MGKDRWRRQPDVAVARMADDVAAIDLGTTRGEKTRVRARLPGSSKTVVTDVSLKRPSFQPTVWRRPRKAPIVVKLPPGSASAASRASSTNSSRRSTEPASPASRYSQSTPSVSARSTPVLMAGGTDKAHPSASSSLKPATHRHGNNPLMPPFLPPPYLMSPMGVPPTDGYPSYYGAYGAPMLPMPVMMANAPPPVLFDPVYGYYEPYPPFA